jgi:hypothetical protein
VSQARDSPIAQDRALERQARHNILHHPWKYAQNLAANASRIFFNAPYSRRPLYLRTVAVFVVPGALLLALVAAAVSRLALGRRTLPPEGAAFALFAVVSLAVHLPISAYVRMLIPIVPPLLWLVVLGLSPSASLVVAPIGAPDRGDDDGDLSAA